MQIISVGAIATVLLAGHSSAFSPPSQRSSQHISHAASSSSALHGSAADEARALLAKAKALREEAATMQGKSIEEMEEEQREKKKFAQERNAVVETARKEREESQKSRTNMQIIPVPEDAKSQIEQAASAVERAFADGVVRQTVQFALLEEEEAMSGVLNEWPGGAKQIYRESGRPLTEMLLSEVRAYSTDSSVDAEAQEASKFSKTPPTVRAEDIWDFDGTAIISATAAAGSHGDVKAVVFPNTDTKYLKDIESYDKEVGPNRLLILVNPFWRDVESWAFNILQPNGKKRAQEVIFDKGYDMTYALLRFSARGEDCIAIKSYPYEWQMYAYREDPAWFNQERPVWLGSSPERPTSAQYTELLNSLPEFKMSKNMRGMQRMMGNDDQ